MRELRPLNELDYSGSPSEDSFIQNKGRLTKVRTKIWLGPSQQKSSRKLNDQCTLTLKTEFFQI